MRGIIFSTLLGAAIGAGWGIGEILADRLINRKESNLSDAATEPSANGSTPVRVRETPVSR